MTLILMYTCLQASNDVSTFPQKLIPTQNLHFQNRNTCIWLGFLDKLRPSKWDTHSLCPTMQGNSTLQLFRLRWILRRQLFAYVSTASPWPNLWYFLYTPGRNRSSGTVRIQLRILTSTTWSPRLPRGGDCFHWLSSSSLRFHFHYYHNHGRNS